MRTDANLRPTPRLSVTSEPPKMMCDESDGGSEGSDPVIRDVTRTETHSRRGATVPRRHHSRPLPFVRLVYQSLVVQRQVVISVCADGMIQ